MQIAKKPVTVTTAIMKRILLCLLCFMSLSAYAQHTVVVNPDGTHSTGIQTGSSTTIVNPDGTHTTVIENGNDITIANPKGRKLRQTLKSIGKKKSSKKHDRKHTETD